MPYYQTQNKSQRQRNCATPSVTQLLEIDSYWKMPWT